MSDKPQNKDSRGNEHRVYLCLSVHSVAHAGRHDPGCDPQKDLDVKDLSIPSVRHGRRQ